MEAMAVASHASHQSQSSQQTSQEVPQESQSIQGTKHQSSVQLSETPSAIR